MIPPVLRASAVVLLALPAGAAELELRYPALERLIAEQLFTQDGRRYVRGNAAAHCQYAYLETPHISAEDGTEGRLRVTAKFSGRSAMDLFGRCVGMGDSFDLVILASPAARQGAIAMESVKVTSLRDSYYIRRVRAALARSFSKDFKIDIRQQARKLLEQPQSGPYSESLTEFDLSGVRVTPEGLVLEVEFKLVVK